MITKRKGERGSPCLMPLVKRKGQEGVPLTRIEKKGEEVRLRIQSTQWLEKPKDSKTDRRYCQLNLSKAFERSSLISIPGIFLVFKELITSLASMTL